MATNQKLSAVMSGLMGIVFGCSIVYILSRLIAAQRRIAALEQHITRKADDDVVVSLTTQVNEVNAAMATISSEVKRTLLETQQPKHILTPPTLPAELPPTLPAELPPTVPAESCQLNK